MFKKFFNWIKEILNKIENFFEGDSPFWKIIEEITSTKVIVCTALSFFQIVGIITNKISLGTNLGICIIREIIIKCWEVKA